MLKKDVPVTGVGVFSLCPNKDHVAITLAPITPLGNMPMIIISWDEMIDMEALYEKCKEMQLKSFKPVAEALGTMYYNRELYEALLQ